MGNFCLICGLKPITLFLESDGGIVLEPRGFLRAESFHQSKFGFKKHHALLTRFYPSVFLENLPSIIWPNKQTLEIFSRDAFQVLFNAVTRKSCLWSAFKFLWFSRIFTACLWNQGVNP